MKAFHELSSALELNLIRILQNERHSYEKCQYEEFKKRVAKMEELKAQKGDA